MEDICTLSVISDIKQTTEHEMSVYYFTANIYPKKLNQLRSINANVSSIGLPKVCEIKINDEVNAKVKSEDLKNFEILEIYEIKHSF